MVILTWPKCFCLFLKIYFLKARVLDWGVRKLPSPGSLFRWQQQPELEQSELHVGSRKPNIQTTFDCFSHPLAGRWIRIETTETWVDAHRDANIAGDSFIHSTVPPVFLVVILQKLDCSIIQLSLENKSQCYDAKAC